MDQKEYQSNTELPFLNIPVITDMFYHYFFIIRLIKGEMQTRSTIASEDIHSGS